MVIKIRFLHSNNNWLENSEYTLKEQGEIYSAQLQDVLDNTRWYLDNLEYMRDYRVSWHNYSKKIQNKLIRPVLPQHL